MQLTAPWSGFFAGCTARQRVLAPIRAGTHSRVHKRGCHVGVPFPRAGLTAALACRCSPWPVRTARTGASPAWTRDWRTSFPRGSFQRSCCKPRGVAWGPLHPPSTHPSPGFHLPCKHHWSQCQRDAGENLPPYSSCLSAKGRAGGRGLGCSRRAQDAAAPHSHQPEEGPWGLSHRGEVMGQHPRVPALGNGCSPRDSIISGGCLGSGSHPFRVGNGGKKMIPSSSAGWSSVCPMLHLSPAPRLRRPAWDQPLWPPPAPGPSRRKLGIFLPSRNPNPAGARGVRRSPRAAPGSPGADARCSVTFYERPARRARRASC